MLFFLFQCGLSRDVGHGSLCRTLVLFQSVRDSLHLLISPSRAIPLPLAAQSVLYL